MACYRWIKKVRILIFQCSRTCGLGTRRRVLRCSGKDEANQYKAVNDTVCAHLSKPTVDLREPCYLSSCDDAPTARWFVSPWNKVSGHQRTLLPVHHIDTPIFNWFVSPWNKVGVHERTVLLVTCKNVPILHWFVPPINSATDISIQSSPFVFCHAMQCCRHVPPLDICHVAL